MAPKISTARDEVRKKEKGHLVAFGSAVILLYRNFTNARTHENICWARSLCALLVYQRVHHAGIDRWSWQHNRVNTYVYFSLVSMYERGRERHLRCVVCTTDLLMYVAIAY